MNNHVNIENDESTVPFYAEHKDGLIAGFFGNFRWLSNFYILENGITVGNLTFPSVEHIYQGMKYPPDKRIQFTECTAGQSKRLGKLAPNLNIKKWNKNKSELMRSLIFQKFEKNIDLRKKLLATEGFKLEERNSWNDVYWGTNIKGEGENTLGIILMNVRDKFLELQQKEKYW